jgi:hypothetical protein
MFDLDQHVRSWRQSASGTLGDGSELLDELEAHLRDEFDRLTASGQPAERAWDAAVLKLGSPQNLASEFAKLQRRFWLPAWMAAGSLALFVALLAWFVIARMAQGRFRPLLAAHVTFVAAGYAAVFATGALGICAVLLRAASGWDERQDAALRFAGTGLSLFALVTTLLGVALGAWWAHDNLGRWWAWDIREIGGLCVLAWAGVLLQSFRSPHSTPQSRTCIAVMGNMVVALAWFGPVFAGTAGAAHATTNGYPPSSVGMFMGGFLIAQMLVVYLALLPVGILRLSRFRGASQ